MAHEHDESRQTPEAVAETVGILPLRDTVLFPHAIIPLGAGRPTSLRLIDEASRAGRLIGVFTQRDASQEEPGETDLHRVGTLASIQRVLKQPDGSVRLIIQGLSRIRLVALEQQQPYLRARVEAVPDVVLAAPELELEALGRNAATSFRQIVEMSPQLPDEMAALVHDVTEPGRLADIIAAALPALQTRVKQE